MVCNVLLALLYLSSGGNERDNEFQTFLEFDGIGDYEEDESFGAFGQSESEYRPQLFLPTREPKRNPYRTSPGTKTAAFS